MEQAETINPFEREYSKFEKAEIITYLSKLLNNYQVYAHKLRYFSWNIVGQDHIEWSDRFKVCHTEALKHMNRIAVRLGLFNYFISDSWDTILKTSEVKESKSNLTGFEIVKSLVEDLFTLLSIQEDCVKKASDLGDNGTEIMIKQLMCELEHDYHVFGRWLK